MGAAQQLTLKVLRSQCQALEERYPGYRVDVVTRLGVILQLLRQPAGVNVRDKVAAELQDFGDLLGRKTATTEPHAYT
jgi:hypothetical protein